MGIISGPFVSKEGAKKLLHYNYQGEDRSLCAKYYYPFWKKVAVLFPLRTSPNQISLLGTAFPIAAFLYMYALGYVFLHYANILSFLPPSLLPPSSLLSLPTPALYTFIVQLHHLPTLSLSMHSACLCTKQWTLWMGCKAKE
jgi:hypothetical protein